MIACLCFDAAKVECDYAIENATRQSQFQSHSKHLQIHLSIGRKKFLEKIMRLKAEAFNRTFQSQKHKKSPAHPYDERDP